MAEQDVYREGEKSEQEGSQISTQASDHKEETKTSTASGEKITVKIGKNYDSFNNTIAEIENMAKYPERGHESFMINKRTNSAIAIRQNGQINMSASMYSQYKLNPSGKTVEQSLESVAITNRRKVRADDVVLNEHKLNPYLYELTDMKSLETAHNDHMLVGNFCLYGSVLVKAWEVNLHRYVLLRRPARIPMFSPLLNVPEIHAGLGVTDPLKIDETILAKSNKGYQVNKVYTDSASLIGKEGVDRAGISRNPQIAISGDNAAIGSDGNVITSAGIPKALEDVNIVGMNDQIPNDQLPTSLAGAAMSNKVAQLTGLRARLVWAQLYHETGNFSSRLALEDHNYGGVKVTNNSQPKAGMSPEGGYYRHFNSDDEFAEYHARNLGYYIREDGLGEATTAYQYAVCLQHGGYFTAGLEEYVSGLVNALKKIPK